MTKYVDLTITEFLSAFYADENELINLQSFRGVFPKTYQTTCSDLSKNEELQAQLTQDNKSRNILFVVNSAHNRDKTCFNACFIVNNDLSIDEQNKVFDKAPIQPSIKVETDTGIEAYWLIKDECSERDWKTLQAGLTAYFNSEAKVNNPFCGMRLPFFNQISSSAENNDSKKVKVIAFDPLVRFTVEEMKNAFLPPETRVKTEFKARIAVEQSQNSLNSYYRTEFSDKSSANEMEAVEKPDSLNSCDSSFVSTETDSFPILDEKALYGLAGEIVNEIAKDSESHPAALLAQFLAAFGNIVGFSPHFYTEADAQGVNLYTVVVGKSARGGRKGTSWGNINALFAKADPKWAVDNLQSGGLSSGEGLITRLRDANGDDQGILDKRLLVVEGEFASVLRVKGRETNTLDAILRNAWDRKPLSKMISSKVDSMSVTDPHFSFIGHITEEELKSLIKDVDAYNGYANRILWVCTKRTKKLPRGGGFFKRDITEYVEELRNAIISACNVTEIDFDDEANQLWTEFYLNIDDTETGTTAAVLARAEAQVIRLAMLYALVDKSKIIHRVHLEAALALWQYCEDSVRYIFGEGLSAGAKKLLEALREAGENGLSRFNIFTNVFNKNRSKAEINSWIAELRNLIIYDVDKKLYFSKESNLTNDEINEFDDFSNKTATQNDLGIAV